MTNIFIACSNIILSHIMKQNDKQNIVAAIQKNLRIMQQQAQQYIQKHHTNLPALCSARHYLFHSLSKRNTIDIPLSARRPIQTKQTKDSEMSNLSKATIYNIQFKKRSFDNRYSPIKQAELSRSLLNSTSLKTNGGWKLNKQSSQMKKKSTIYRDKSDEKMKTIVMNSQIVGLADSESLSNYNAFSPKMSKMDLSKKQAEMIERYHSRFRQTKRDSPPPKPKKKMSNKNNGKSLQTAKDILDSELLQNTEPIRKRKIKRQKAPSKVLNLNYSQIMNPEQQIILRYRKPRISSYRVAKKSELKSKQKIEVVNEYSPWQSNNQQITQLQEFIGDEVF